MQKLQSRCFIDQKERENSERTAIKTLVQIRELGSASKVLLSSETLRKFLTGGNYTESLQFIKDCFGNECLDIIKNITKQELSKELETRFNISKTDHDTTYLSHFIEYLEYITDTCNSIREETITEIVDSKMFSQHIEEKIIDKIVVKMTSTSSHSLILKLLENKRVIMPYREGFFRFGDALLRDMIE